MLLEARNRLCHSTLLLACLLVHGAGAETVDQRERMAFAKQVDAELINNPDEAEHWLSHGRTWAEDRFSPLAQISVDTIDRLGLAWSLDLPSKGSMEATPLVADGIIYTSGSWGEVFAVDGQTGELLWRFDPEAQKRTAEAIAWDRHRGVALWQGKVYVAVADGRLIALDALSGEVIWTAQTFDRNLPYGITGAPRVFDGRVIIGMSGGDVGTRGYASAYDAETGKLLWRFYAVPGNPADGFESKAMAMAAKTWNGNWWQYGGGGNPWNAFSYDAELGLVYLGMGNGGPWSQKTRSPGGGDNLFLASIVAVKVDTGEYVWHYQNTPGEIWDYPAAMDMILADLEIDGKRRKVLMQAPKNGFFYVLDRETGELLSAKNFVRVTWAKFIDPDTGRPVEAEGARFESGPMEIAPDFSGGHSWYPMSFNPGTGLVYIPYLQSSAILDEPDFNDWEFTRGAFDMPIMRPSQSPVSGGLLAWDPVKQEQAWRFELPSIHLGGTATTAGNLVFAGTGDGRLLAFDALTGTQLWDAPANNAVMGGPAVYSVDGEEYVTVLAGIGGGFAQKFNLIDYGYEYGKDRRLLAFKLGGKASLAAREPVHVDRTIAPLSDDPQVQRGADLYMPYCGTCHGFAGLNAGVAPVLRTSPMLDALPEILLDGVLTDQGMPSFAQFLSSEDVQALEAYLKELASLEGASWNQEQQE